MIESILKNSVQFEGAENFSGFTKAFTNLYNIELFKDGLDLILTKAQNGEFKFEVKIIKDWDTNVGCCVTEESKVYNKILKTFTSKLSHKITIRNFLNSVMAHEVAHALEKESGLVLNEDFRTAIGFDMRNRSPNNFALKGEIKRIMVEGVKSYPHDKIISELFARYFELLSMSRNVAPSGDFTTVEVMDFFVNTTNFVKKIVNDKIKSKIDSDIAKYTASLISQKAFETKKVFAEKVDSFYKKVDSKGQKSWSANTKSTSDWQASWNQHQKNLEDKKNN